MYKRLERQRIVFVDSLTDSKRLYFLNVFDSLKINETTYMKIYENVQSQNAYRTQVSKRFLLNTKNKTFQQLFAWIKRVRVQKIMIFKNINRAKICDVRKPKNLSEFNLHVVQPTTQLSQTDS